MTPTTDILRIYLSGGMEYAVNEGKDWRHSIQEWLEQNFRCIVFNPNNESERFLGTQYPGIDFRRLKIENLPAFTSIVSKIVHLDCSEIANRTDMVICYWDEGAMRGAGTKGELTIAKYTGKPVYLVTSIPYHEIPGWVLGCTTQLFASFEELKRFLTESNQ